ncbi:MAG: PRC-barrel domain-containing protein, partial [Opitutales bacterium]
MKQQLSILAGGLLAFGLPLQTHAQAASAPSTSQADYAQNVPWTPLDEYKITNFQGQTLGHIQDVALDVPGGQVVEILVVSDQFFGFGGKTVALPPSALDFSSEPNTYCVDMTREKFAAAPKFDLSKWSESTQTDQVAAAYEYFGQAPKFLITGEAPGRKSMA